MYIQVLQDYWTANTGFFKKSKDTNQSILSKSKGTINLQSIQDVNFIKQWTSGTDCYVLVNYFDEVILQIEWNFWMLYSCY